MNMVQQSQREEIKVNNHGKEGRRESKEEGRREGGRAMRDWRWNSDG